MMLLTANVWERVWCFNGPEKKKQKEEELRELEEYLHYSQGAWKEWQSEKECQEEGERNSQQHILQTLSSASLPLFSLETEAFVSSLTILHLLLFL